MKHALIASILAWSFCAVSCEGADLADKKTSPAQVPVTQGPVKPAKEAAAGQKKHVEVSVDEDYGGDDENRIMPKWRSYDPNTGLPNIVESDRAGEI